MIKAVATLGNYIYAIGGSNDEATGSNVFYGEGIIKTVERYDVLNDKWEFVASMKYERGYHEAVIQNKFF